MERSGVGVRKGNRFGNPAAWLTIAPRKGWTKINAGQNQVVS